MKTFKNYLQNDSLEETLLDHIKNHLIVEMYSYDFMPFFEALGNFNNCGRVAEYVLSQILKNTENNLTIDCKKFKVFFDSTVLNIKTDLSYHMEYDFLENRVLTINIYLKKLTIKRQFIWQCMMHSQEERNNVAKMLKEH